MPLRVLTIGTFDLCHKGHLALLARASAFGTLYVGVNGDRFVTRYKGQPPVQNEGLRIGYVRQLPMVDGACINDGPGDNLIRFAKPDLLVVGSDWHDHYLEQIKMTARELFDELRCGVVYLPRTPGVSTTSLRT